MQQILLLHGAIGAEEQLFPLRDELQSSHYDIHTLNFSGHGRKPMPVHFSIESFAEETLAYIRQYDLQELYVFGYSMGGYVAMYLSSLYPGLIKKIITLGTKYSWSPEIAAKEIKMLRPEIIEEKVPAFAEILSRRHGENEWKILVKATAAMLTKLGNKPLLENSCLEKISSDTLLLIGEKDNMVSLEETINAAEQLNNSSVFILPDTFHPIEQVNTKMLSEKMLTFL